MCLDTARAVVRILNEVGADLPLEAQLFNEETNEYEPVQLDVATKLPPGAVAMLEAHGIDGDVFFKEMVCKMASFEKEGAESNAKRARR